MDTLLLEGCISILAQQSPMLAWNMVQRKCLSSNSWTDFHLYFFLKYEPKCQAGLAKHPGEGLFSNLCQQRGLCSLYWLPCFSFFLSKCSSFLLCSPEKQSPKPSMPFCIQCIVSSNNPLACLNVLIADDPRLATENISSFVATVCNYPIAQRNQWKRLSS